MVLNRIPVKLASLALPIFLWNACANIVEPTGGQKDTEAPKLKSSIPKNQATNFKGKEITMNFDEFIQLKNPEKEIIISPNLKNPLEYKFSKKRITIKLNDTLTENTTYTLNFGNSLADINEGNLDSNFTFAFSTGDKIDTTKVKGSVQNALNGKALIAATVFLVKDTMPSFNKKFNILYYARTKSDGTFILSNIKKSDYYLFVLKDENANKIYDSYEEEIGFLQDRIEITKDTTVAIIKTFKQIRPNDLKFNYDKNNFSSGQGNLMETKIIDSLNQENLVVTRYSDSLKIQYLEVKSDSSFIKFVDLKTKLDTAIKIRTKKLEPKTAILNLKKSSYRIDEPIILESYNPIKNFNKEKIILLEDSVKGIEKNIFLDGNNPYQIHVKAKFEEGKKYYIRLEKGAVIDKFDQESLSNTVALTLIESRELSKLLLQVKNKENRQYIVQLLDENQKIIHQEIITKSQKIDIPFLMPGKYSLQVVDDSNQNGRWDSGNLEEKKQSESIVFYDKTISIKANWEQELIWEPIL